LGFLNEKEDRASFLVAFDSEHKVKRNTETFDDYMLLSYFRIMDIVNLTHEECHTYFQSLRKEKTLLQNKLRLVKSRIYQKDVMNKFKQNGCFLRNVEALYSIHKDYFIENCGLCQNAEHLTVENTFETDDHTSNFGCFYCGLKCLEAFD
jgi:hypothetical protein